VSAVADELSPSSVALAGGICGDAYARFLTIDNCYNTGEVSAVSSNETATSSAGGILGRNEGAVNISRCYNSGDISSVSTSFAYAGGILSKNRYLGGLSGNITITNCYNVGNVSAVSNISPSVASGIFSYSNSTSKDFLLVIENCYNAGELSASSSGSSAYAGSIIGYIPIQVSSFTNNSYWNIDAAQTVNGSSQEPKKGIGFGADLTTPLTAEQMRGEANKGNFAGFNFNGVWGYIDGVNNNYPILLMPELCTECNNVPCFCRLCPKCERTPCVCNAAEEYHIVPSVNNLAAHINLATEMFALPAGFTIGAFSLDNGAKWRTGTPDLAKILNRGMTLRVAEGFDRATKRPTGAVIAFPRIDGRPRGNPERLNLKKLNALTLTGATLTYEYATTATGPWTAFTEPLPAPAARTTYFVRTSPASTEQTTAAPASYTPSGRVFRVNIRP
jgi:hypothetical protein